MLYNLKTATRPTSYTTFEQEEATTVMDLPKEPSPPDFAEQLQALSSAHFTGRWDVCSPHGTIWSFYLCLGRVVWQTGGIRPVDRWRRLLSQHCRKVDHRDLEQVGPLELKRVGYSILMRLLRQQQLQREQMIALVEAALLEVMFEILQEQASLLSSARSSGSWTYHADPNDQMDAPMTLIRVSHSLQEAQRLWSRWQEIGMAHLSPNLAPVIRQPDLLQQQVSDPTFQLLTRWVDGQHSLHSLAVKMQQDLLDLAQSFFPYVASGIMGFIELQDVDNATKPITDINVSPVPLPSQPLARASIRSASGPLVMCIDDSPLVCKSLERILTPAGYRFLGIQDSLQAIPMLLKHKPGLVFLDLIMPVANGYEICAQIRRVSKLKDLPVVILTGNDGIVDRVRAKVVGSTDFIAKPVDPDRVLPIVARYLPISVDSDLSQQGA